LQKKKREGDDVNLAIESTILISALAGLGSFLSPCILPIIPGFLSYLSSSSLKEAANDDTSTNDEKKVHGNNIESKNPNGVTNQVIFVSKKARVNIFINTIYFVLGFSLVFSVLGVILNSVFASSIFPSFNAKKARENSSFADKWAKAATKIRKKGLKGFHFVKVKTSIHKKRKKCP